VVALPSLLGADKPDSLAVRLATGTIGLGAWVLSGWGLGPKVDIRIRQTLEGSRCSLRSRQSSRPDTQHGGSEQADRASEQLPDQVDHEAAGRPVAAVRCQTRGT